MKNDNATFKCRPLSDEEIDFLYRNAGAYHKQLAKHLADLKIDIQQAQQKFNSAEFDGIKPCKSQQKRLAIQKNIDSDVK